MEHFPINENLFFRRKTKDALTDNLTIKFKKLIQTYFLYVCVCVTETPMDPFHCWIFPFQ